MPRGKYPRQSAAVKAAIVKTAAIAAPAAVVPDSEPAALDPVLLADAVAIVTQATKVAEVAISNARRPHRFADHAKSRDIDSLPIDQLRAYGLEIGMSRRDCAELSEPRLRAGCRSHLAHHFDALTE